MTASGTRFPRESLVSNVSSVSIVPAGALNVDSRDRAFQWPNTAANTRSAYIFASVFHAYERIRGTDPFTNAAALKPVRVAVIDTAWFYESKTNAP